MRGTAVNSTGRIETGRWTTPQRLHAFLVAISILAILLLLLIALGVLQRRYAVQTIGKDAAPSIIAAQRIKASLADMDANVVNELMVRPGESAQSIKGYTDRRKEVTDSLIKAAENITYGDRERTPILLFASGLGEYEELASRARTLHERQDPQMLPVYRQVDHLLQETLYPAIDALTKANNDALTQTYSGVQTASIGLLALILVVGGALLGVLIATQVFLSTKMRRTFNLPLLGATLTTFCLLAYTFLVFRAEDQDLKVARQDAFMSIQALLQARAIAYDANTDESRWLLDRPQAAAYEEAFFEKSARLTAFPQAEMYDQIQAASSQGRLPSGVKGLFADELNNITFTGEGAAAAEMFRAYGFYFGMDKKIRSLENEGNHAESVRFCISMSPGESNWAFSKFDDALQKTIDINQKEFDRAIDRGFAEVRGLDIAALVIGVLLILLSLAGLRPRIREYQF